MSSEEFDPQFERVWQATVAKGHLLPNANEVKRWCAYFWRIAKEDSQS